MKKKTIITILFALVAILLVSIAMKGQKKSVKSAEAKPKDAVEQKKPHLLAGFQRGNLAEGS